LGEHAEFHEGGLNRHPCDDGFTSIEIVPFARIWQCHAIDASAWVLPNLLTAFLINAIACVARPG
jgi:hypothetical protein